MYTNLALWTPDIFTHTENVFVDTHDTAVLSVARDRYALPGRSVQQSCGFEANSQNFLVDGVLLKRIRGERPTIEYQLAAYAYLHGHGIATPEIIPNNDDDFLTMRDGTMWLAMEYIDGHFYKGTMDEIEAIIDMMPRLFHLLRNYMQILRDYGQTPLDGFPHRPIITAPYVPRCDYAMLGSELEHILRCAMSDIVSLSEHVCQATHAWIPTTSLVHIDLHPRNMLWSHDKLYLLDFDSLQLQPSVIAYNFAVYKMLRRCVADGMTWRPYIERLFADGTIPREALAAQAEILLRLLSILDSSSPGNLSVWQQLIPVHLRGLCEAGQLLGEDVCAMC